MKNVFSGIIVIIIAVAIVNAITDSIGRNLRGEIIVYENNCFIPTKSGKIAVPGFYDCQNAGGETFLSKTTYKADYEKQIVYVDGSFMYREDHCLVFNYKRWQCEDHGLIKKIMTDGHFLSVAEPGDNGGLVQIPHWFYWYKIVEGWF